MGGSLSSPAAPATSASGDAKTAVVVVHSSAEWNQKWQSAVETNKLMVIYFTATWCGPCKAMAPLFQEMASRYTDALFNKIDIDDLPEVAKQWNVQSVPTVVLAKGGKEVGRIIGLNPAGLETQIKEKLNI